MAIVGLLMGMPEGVRPCGDLEACIELGAEIAASAEIAGRATGVDPVVLVAIAHNESRFDASRGGKLGKGLFGLNPRTRMYRDAEALCGIFPEHCVLAQAVVAARYVADERRRCGGLEGAIRSYGSGRCDSPGGARHLRAWRASRAVIRKAMKGEQ